MEVRRPTAYLIPSNQTKAIEVLQGHGIKVDRLEKPEFRAVTVDRIDAITRSSRVFEGHRLLDITATTSRIEPRDCPAGMLVVPTAQPLGSLAIYLLEPRSDDGLATWGFFDDEIAPGRDFPIGKVD